MSRGGHGEVDNTLHTFLIFIASLSANSSFVLRLLTVFGLFGSHVIGWFSLY
jgi:hypothetical protein